MEVNDKIIQAYKMVLSKDRHLLDADVNERSITHRFAIYLQELFPEYNVDCEYNRNDLDEKKLKRFMNVLPESDDTNGSRVYPDIIIHHRGTKENFIVIEAKKTSSRLTHQQGGSCPCDECKLRLYRSELGYRHAYFVIFPVKRMLREFTDDRITKYVKKIQ